VFDRPASEFEVSKSRIRSHPDDMFCLACSEGAGVVVKVGPSVQGWKVGDRAGVKPVWDTCGSCELCLGDKETYCPFAQWTGLSKVGLRSKQDLCLAALSKRFRFADQGHLSSPVPTSNTSFPLRDTRPESPTA
jgi:threonine dehydrogenase-like Zn-dependent dehydrogenase